MLAASTILGLLIALFIPGTLAQPPLAQQYESFKGHKVLRIVPHTHSQVVELHRLEEQLTELDYWSQPYNINHEVDIRIPPYLQSYMVDFLAKWNMTYSVLIDDVQAVLDAEIESIVKSRRKRSTDDMQQMDNEILNSFSSHEEINRWLERKSQTCSSRCSIHDIGQTHENRTIRVIKISSTRRRSNKAIWIDGGIHAREWISPVVANNIIHKLITEYSRNRCVRHIIENFDWYILPVANPDGYEYSRIRNRMWRKNRKVTESAKRPWWVMYYYGSSVNYRPCYGVDLNRNFGFKWGQTGTSTNPCSDIYGGPEAFSEPESVAIRDFIRGIHSSSRLSVYLSLHAYGQYWLYSWGYTRDLPANHMQLDRVAIDSANAIWSTDGTTTYTVGAAARTLYASSGASDDWTKGELGVKYAFTLELPPSDANARGNGFLLPASRIPTVASATWPGVRTMAVKVLQADRTRATNHSRHDFCNTY